MKPIIVKGPTTTTTTIETPGPGVPVKVQGETATIRFGEKKD